MPTTSYKAPGTVSGYTNSNNAKVSDDVWATNNVNSGFPTGATLLCTNFGFTTSDVPAGSLILGIEVNVERSYTTGGTAKPKDLTVQLIVAGSQTGDNKAVAGNWNLTTDTVQAYGSASDAWNAGLTDSIVIASTFGVAVQAQYDTGSGTATCRIDYVELRITYTGFRKPGIVVNQAIMRASGR